MQTHWRQKICSTQSASISTSKSCSLSLTGKESQTAAYLDAFFHLWEEGTQVSCTAFWSAKSSRNLSWGRQLTVVQFEHKIIYMKFLEISFFYDMIIFFTFQRSGYKLWLCTDARSGTMFLCATALPGSLQLQQRHMAEDEDQALFSFSDGICIWQKIMMHMCKLSRTTIWWSKLSQQDPNQSGCICMFASMVLACGFYKRSRYVRIETPHKPYSVQGPR